MLEENLTKSVMNNTAETEEAVLSQEMPANDEENNGMSKDEVVGFHKGSINTLIAERNELLKMVSVCEQLINAHASELAKHGINVQKQTG